MLGLPSVAFEGHELTETMDAVLNSADSQNTIVAWRVFRENSGEVRVLLQTGDEHSFDEAREATQLALQKLAKSLLRQDIDLHHNLENLSVWRLDKSTSTSDHPHGDDVWINIQFYGPDGLLKTSFVQCHKHEGAEELVCHYSRKGIGEPQFDE